MMNLAELWGFRRIIPIPAATSTVPEEKRQRYLTADELQRLGSALRDRQDAGGQWPYFIATIKLLLLTGARVSEFSTLDGPGFPQTKKSSACRTAKTGAKTLYLSEGALAVLNELQSRPEYDRHGYIVCGRLAGRPLVNLAKPWKQLCNDAGI